eukprot:TRINITY_DN12136_c0_g1_i4.p1 TRINITY_DN12136_c0_g1~~TRINITY_DN12136_c0_g1_i4.p1  ORF type:complete len:590 (+),score=76.43 TRINITY_DN12136_c0_g1_i4:110-1879(+)
MVNKLGQPREVLLLACPHCTNFEEEYRITKNPALNGDSAAEAVKEHVQEDHKDLSEEDQGKEPLKKAFKECPACAPDIARAERILFNPYNRTSRKNAAKVVEEHLKSEHSGWQPWKRPREENPFSGQAGNPTWRILDEQLDHEQVNGDVNALLDCIEQPSGVKELDFSWCLSLKAAPDLRKFNNLRRLDMSGCLNLLEAPEISGLPHLKEANFSRCIKLKRAPNKIGRKGQNLRMLWVPSLEPQQERHLVDTSLLDGGTISVQKWWKQWEFPQSEGQPAEPNTWRWISGPFEVKDQVEATGVTSGEIICGKDLRSLNPFLLFELSGFSPPAFSPPHPHAGMDVITYQLRGTCELCDWNGHKVALEPGDAHILHAKDLVVHHKFPTTDDCLSLELWVKIPKNAHDRVTQVNRTISHADIELRRTVTMNLTERTVLGLPGSADTTQDILFLDIDIEADNTYYRYCPLGNKLVFVLEGIVAVSGKAVPKSDAEVRTCSPKARALAFYGEGVYITAIEDQHARVILVVANSKSKIFKEAESMELAGVIAADYGESLNKWERIEKHLYPHNELIRRDNLMELYGNIPAELRSGL